MEDMIEREKGHRKTGRGYRRVMRIRKERRLKQIIRQERLYYPFRIEEAYVDGVWQEVGNHIQYAKNSGRKQCLKGLSNRKVRRYPYLLHKGNQYRRMFDYWWRLS